MNHLPVEAKRVVYLTVILATLIVLSVIAAFVFARNSPVQPIEISACSTVEFETNNQVCEDRSGVTPPDELQPFELNDSLVFDVSGNVRSEADVATSYSILVQWISTTGSPVTEPGESFVGLSTPITWPANVDRHYDAAWSPPGLLLEHAVGLPPGTDLGKWRIVGTATPVNTEDYVPFQWDSVRTFTLETPTEGTS